MLEKIDRLRNIGLFARHDEDGSSEFGPLTLIFGENGVGKTTLAAVIDSLRESSPDSIVRRRSLPGDKAPEASVTLDGVTYAFDGASWDAQPPYDTVDVFCPDFVNRNVYAGGGVGPDHRRNLCELVLGRHAVADVVKLAAATDASTNAASERKRLEGELRQLVKPVHTLDEFVRLGEDPDIDKKLAAAVKALAEARSAEATAKRLVPSAVHAVAVDRTLIDRMLTATNDQVGTDVATVVREHVEQHLDQQGEEWLSYGAVHTFDDACPFCGQDVSGVELVEAIRAYFGDQYRALVDSIQADIASLRVTLGSVALAGVRTEMASQIAIAASWGEQYTVDVVALNATLEHAEAEWKKAAASLKELIDRKVSAPLDAISPREADTVVAGYEAAIAVLEPVNQVLRDCAAAAVAHKSQVSTANVNELTASAQRLENQKARFEPLA